MWPPAVEEVAAVFRSAGVEARLEELAVGEDAFPGPGVHAQAFLCDGRVLVALVPAETTADPARLGCTSVRELAPLRFPFPNADVVIDQSLFNERVVWIDAGSPRHVAGLSPVQLARLVHARTGDFALDAGAPG